VRDEASHGDGRTNEETNRIRMKVVIQMCLVKWLKYSTVYKEIWEMIYYVYICLIREPINGLLIIR